MQARAGGPAKLSRKYSVKSLVCRTIGFFLVAALLATLVYGLISSGGITQKVRLSDIRRSNAVNGLSISKVLKLHSTARLFEVLYQMPGFQSVFDIRHRDH